MTADDTRPQFYIIGAAKAGTTSLYDILGQHPQVFFPFDKEPAYFCDDEYYSRGDAWYLNTFFSTAGGDQLRGEATSRYLYFGKKVAPRILAFSGARPPRFIAIFREPASLVYSFYWNSVREGHENLPFPEALQAETNRLRAQRARLEKRGQILYAYSKVCAYASQVNEYLELFPAERFLFLLTEDLQDFPSLLAKLQSFLELEDRANLIQPARSNPAALPKNPGLHSWLRKTSLLKELVKPLIPYPLRHRLKMSLIENNLAPFTPPSLDPEIANSLRLRYREETLRLQDLLGRDLSTWLPA